ncbi:MULTISPECIES: hypothetical protein [unclassified Mesorhizobium]|uniref:hypothetical protein n=1 Tax=unclassified Mesorhizobium TaxID=325217 RepID=UPI0011277CE1|nr:MULTISPECIES: hypothetical protein [unclassified Mesorhizobium]MBZ9734800.1 hypothetical protein [Mesorhizobium sp. CA9]MBZ9827099.1 hypothetical protein [Mesorhizobium sp. CA18]MBZ9832543.1 hypothetical protein [Mesorhizobium sp. CA2]MBZ9838711.1 hypothetical protein [Mesorhizobium sp. CA3]MBZ9844591.1 hypothetical protein [Mesorhizobium sp. CA5]
MLVIVFLPFQIVRERSAPASISRIGFIRKPLRTFRSDANERSNALRPRGLQRFFQPSFRARRIELRF